MRNRVFRTVDQKFKNIKAVEHIQNTELQAEQELTFKLFSPEITFSEPVVKKLSNSNQSINFTAKPKDSCYPGNHQAIFSICDNKTNLEFQSISFTVQITDFVFDHVSRPLFTNGVSIFLGIGSLAMFTLTLLGQIDSTFGLASGTVAGSLASAVYMRFVSLYQRIKVTHTP
jgi:hypothetical protein